MNGKMLYKLCSAVRMSRFVRVPRKPTDAPPLSALALSAIL